MATTECPVCGGEIEGADGTLVGELTPCPDCGAELEVTSLEPFSVEQSLDEGEADRSG